MPKAQEPDPFEATKMTFGEHLEELRVALAWGDLEEDMAEAVLETCDRVRRLIWGLLH